MRCTLQRGGGPEGGFEVAFAPVPAELKPWVDSWTGYREWSASIVQRLETPSGRAVLIFELGEPIGIGERLVRHRGGFYAAIGDVSVLTAFNRVQEGIQVNLTPRGAHALLGRETRDLSGLVTGVGAVRFCDSFCDELASARGWEARLDVVFRALAARLPGAKDQSNVVKWAVERIDHSRGAVRIDALSDELGYSRKHLHARFVDEVGMAPKRYAALRRFEHVVGRLRAGRFESFAQLATEAGYSDQAHLAREVRRFSGASSTALAEAAKDPIAVAIAALTS